MEIPRDLPWEKKIKNKAKKNDDMSVIPLVNPSVNPLVNCEHYSSCQLQRELPTEFSRELQNCSPSNCTVNCCYLRTKSPTD